MHAPLKRTRSPSNLFLTTIYLKIKLFNNHALDRLAIENRDRLAVNKPGSFAPRTPGLLRRAVGGGKQRYEAFPFKSSLIYGYIVIYIITCYKNTHLILHYNNWVFLKITSAARSCDIANSLCLKCSKSKGSSNTTPPCCSYMWHCYICKPQTMLLLS